MAGHIYFIGAGPGDPDLLTLKAQKLIAAADVVIYAGSLVNPDILAHAPAGAAIHNSANLNLARQIALMQQAIAGGQTVVRLHTGDPTIYGATLEQMRELDKAAIPYTVVPGVSSAFAATAALKTELTAPHQTQTIIFTRLAGRTPVPDTEQLRDLAAHRTSLVLFLSTGMIARVVEELDQAGYEPDTPVAVVYRASWPDELVVRGTLVTIVDQLQAAEVTHQALISVSPVLRPAARRQVPDSHLYGAAFAAQERRDSPAIITLTRLGTETGKRLHALYPGAVLYAPARFVAEDNQDVTIRPYLTSVRQTLQSAFAAHKALVCLMATGIVVRDLAPVLRSKHTDPAVVVLDETYLRLIRDIAPDIPRTGTGMRQEVRRVNQAIDLARTGRQVALISGGDAGIYGMAGLVYEVLRERAETVAVEVIPGVSALNAAAALLGAPVMTDFAAISLSDQLTPRRDILRRVELAVQAGFILCLYNPKGKNRVEPFRLTCDILANHLPPETPVGVVRAAYREKQQVDLITLAELPAAEVNMVTLIIIGNKRTLVHNDKMITPRGYAAKYTLDQS